MRRLALVAVAALLVSCGRQAVSPQVLQQYQDRSLFTCCNLYHEGAELSDADYHVGTLLPFGTPVKVEKMTGRAVTFDANGTKLTLNHQYGTEQESAQQYFDKILVVEDPKPTVAAYPEQVRNAIREGRVEIGMSKPQVIASLGYPPTHRTANTSAPEWTYWYNRWVTYKIQFDDAGLVSRFIGTNVPTNNQPIVVAAPTPQPAKAKAAPAKKKKK